MKTKLTDRETACCHAPVLRESFNDEYIDFCWECGRETPEVFIHSGASAVATAARNSKVITDSLLKAIGIHNEL